MNDDLFLNKIFRNCYLRKNIFNHVRLFNNNYHKQEFSIETLSIYPYREYLRSIIIKDFKDEDQYLLCKLLNSLPNIEFLESEKVYNRELPKISVTTIKALKFGEDYNQTISVYCLPMKTVQHNLTSLTLGSHFNQTIDSFHLLDNLKTLVLGDGFNQVIKKDSLPNSIENLTFGSSYNKKILYGVLPTSLQYLKLGPSHHKMIFTKKSKRQSSFLYNLLFNNHKKQIICEKEEEQDKSLKNLKVLELGEFFNFKLSTLGDIPTSIQAIRFGGIWNQKFKLKNISKFQSLTSLRFGRLYNNNNQDIDSLPPCLKSLHFSFHFNNSIKESAIPPTLETIVYGYMYNRPINYLRKATALKSLTFGHCFSQSFIDEITNESILPPSVTMIDLSESTRFDHSFDRKNSLPQNLVTLILYKKFKRQISFLPSSLKDFEVNITESNIQYLEQNLPISKIIFKSNLPVSVIIKSIQKKDKQLPYEMKSSTNIKSIEFDYFYNSVFKLFKIPNSVEQCKFNQLIDISLLKSTLFPKNLKTLHINYIGERELIIDSNSLPQSITSLYIDNVNSIPIKVLSLPPLCQIYCKNSNTNFINYCLDNNLYQSLKIIE